ncbi:MAG: ABC transporter substrate-binding protein [Erysipelotrichaceae bacterium]|nr:ABC transporter substrate-binding protein [Erysipelotrichaceae bacterium]MDD3923855.1 ABC transporter substrate-binding protein [Erysipelotrichaceae bacterium]
MKKLIKLIALLMVISLILTGCQSSPVDESTIKVGINMELSGEVASYGQAELNGIKLAIKQVNANGGVLGKEIELIEVDNTSSASEATSVTTRLVSQDNVVAILGPATSGAFKASLPVSEEYGVAIISPSATDTTVMLNDTTKEVFTTGFRTCFIDSFQGVTMANFAYDNLSLSKAVVFGDNSSDYAQGLADSFIAQFKANGGTIVAHENFTKGDTDFNAVLTKIADMDFDVLFVPGYYNEAGLLIKQAREMGLNVPILGADGFESPDLIALAGVDNIVDVFYSTHYSSVGDDQLVADFVTAFSDEYGTEPNAFSALAYDAAMLLVDAIERANDADPSKIIEALLDTDGFVGVAGNISIDNNHDAVKSIYVVELSGDKAINSVKVNP